MTDLAVIKPEPTDPSVRERLVDLLDRVDRDEVSAVAFAVIYRDGNTGTAWSVLPHRMLMMGVVAHLAWRLSQKFEDD